MKDDAVYLRHILESIRRIEQDVAGGREQFLTSHLHQDAVLRNLHTLSESTQRLSEVCKAAYPGIPWRSVAAFRNIMVHDYLGVDLEKVWEIVQRDVPALKKTIQAMLRERA